MNYFIKKTFSFIVLILFIANTLAIPSRVWAEDYYLPTPGAMVHLSRGFKPPLLRGLTIHPNDPFRIDFFINKGEETLSVAEKKKQYQSLVKYFLAALAIPDEDQWVNLSPYEKSRIIEDDFSGTLMGRDLLGEDYMLKEITASLIYPEDEIGKKFWTRVYTEAKNRFGTTNIPVNTFNKVWILPERAVVYENAKAGTAYIVESKLKVLLEQDYLSLFNHNRRQPGGMALAVSPHTGDYRWSSPSTLPAEPAMNAKASQGYNPATSENANALGSQIIREVVIPQLTKEVNEGENFARLRQMYSAMILATWYKRKIKGGIWAQLYIDKNKIQGLTAETRNDNVRTQDFVSVQDIYQRYLQAFKRGVYNYIKEEPDPITREMIPRKYFSGGFRRRMENGISADPAMFVIEDPKSLSFQETNRFNEEASKRQIDLVTVVFSPVLDQAMTSKVALKNLLARIGVSLLMTGLWNSDLKAMPPQVQQLIVAQDQRWNVKPVVNLNTEMERSLNAIFNSYIFRNRGHLLTASDRMPFLLSKTAGINFSERSLPYTFFSKIIKDCVVRLNKKQKNGHLSSGDQYELNHLRAESVLLVQKVLLAESRYNAEQHTVQGLIIGKDNKRAYDCESISITTVIIARDWGFDGVYDVDIKELNGEVFPHIINGIEYGHVANVILDPSAPVQYFDQGKETLPVRIIIYDKRDGVPVVLEADKIGNAPNASPRSLEDIVLDQEAYNKSQEFFVLRGLVEDQLSHHQSDQASETMSKLDELMPWMEANTAALNRNQSFIQQNILAVIARVKRIKAEMSQPVASDEEIAEYVALKKTIEYEFEQADELIIESHFSEAREKYEEVSQKADAEYERLNVLKDKLASSDKPVDLRPIKGILPFLDVIGQSAKQRAAEAQQYAVSAGHLEVYEKLLEKIKSLNNEANIALSNKDYKTASERFAAINKLIDDNIEDMRQQLENVRGLVDSDGNPSSGQQLIDSLSQFALDAQKSQNLALGRLLNSLVTRYNYLIQNPDKLQMRVLFEESNGVLERQGSHMSKKVKSKFEMLVKMTHQISDSAMIMGKQPVGGIDLNSKNMELQIEGDAAMDLPFDQTGWQNINILGLVPTINEIRSLSDWAAAFHLT